ncbi:MAG: hypothetical protein ABR511_14805 [Acidimicrobiales bacterium]
MTATSRVRSVAGATALVLAAGLLAVAGHRATPTASTRVSAAGVGAGVGVDGQPAAGAGASTTVAAPAATAAARTTATGGPAAATTVAGRPGPAAPGTRTGATPTPVPAAASASTTAAPPTTTTTVAHPSSWSAEGDAITATLHVSPATPRAGQPVRFTMDAATTTGDYCCITSLYVDNVLLKFPTGAGGPCGQGPATDEEVFTWVPPASGALAVELEAGRVRACAPAPAIVTVRVYATVVVDP